MLFPSFNSIYRTADYNDHYGPSKSQPGSCGDGPCKPTPALSYSESRGVDEEDTAAPGQRRTGLVHLNDTYGMNALTSMGSSDQFVRSHAVRPFRANTAHSKGESDVVAAEPNHILGSAV
jgi:hypothetical protein